MKISERTEAARSIYQDTLQTQKGLMKGIRALSSAAKCFFSSRAVRSWQEQNMPTVSRASTGHETEGAGGTAISERAVASLGAADKVNSDMVTPEKTEDQALASLGTADKVESDVTTPEKIEDQTLASSGEVDKVMSDKAKPEDTKEQTESTDDQSSGEPQLLDNSVAKSKRGAGPQKRRPPSRRNVNRQ